MCSISGIFNRKDFLMRNRTRGLLLVASLMLACPVLAASSGGIVAQPPVQQGQGVGPDGNVGPVGPASSPSVVVPYIGPAGITVYPVKLSGNTAKPGPNSKVKVNYRGWLQDGTEFDSSYARGNPAVFNLNQTIPCWQQGLQSVPVGSKVKLVCPPDTAYGNNQVGQIPPGSTLTFEVDLLEIMD